MGDDPPEDHADAGFSTGLVPWLERLGNLRNVVRQHLVARQLDAHLPPTTSGVGIRVYSASFGLSVNSIAPTATTCTICNKNPPVICCSRL